MTRDEHKARHEALHDALDELAADYLLHHRGRTLSGTNVMQLLTWSHAQSSEPDEPAIAVDAHRNIAPSPAGARSRFLDVPGTGRG